MFPYNNQNPFPYHSTQTLHQNPISTHHGNHQESPFLLHFPSPFLDDTSPLSQVLPQPQTAAGDQVSGKGKTKKGGPRKRNPGTTRGRTGKKDRHSKICTARGVRDRRMRLSLQIARKFFDLQDMLGFDKASKTIEWLFSKSKKAIKELMRTKNMDTNFSSSDEYEVRSIMEENNYSNNNEAITSVKESRQKARARARERTKEKKMVVKGLESSTHFYESNPSSLEQLGSSSNSPFLEESCCQEIGSNNNNNAPLLGFENQFASSVGIMDKYLGGASYGALWAPDWRAESSILSSKYGADSYAIEHHQENGESFMGFLGDGGINPNMDGLPPYAGINPSTLYFGATIPNFQFMQPLDQEKQFPCNHYSLG